MKAFSLVETILYTVFVTIVMLIVVHVLTLTTYTTTYPDLVYALMLLRDSADVREYSDVSLSSTTLSFVDSPGIVLFRCDVYGLHLQDVYATSILMTAPFQCEFGSDAKTKTIYIEYTYHDDQYLYAIK